MYYAPHTLWIKRQPQVLISDEDGHPSLSSPQEEWQQVGPCRADHVSQTLRDSDSGQDFISSYRIVTDRLGIVQKGDTVRATLADDIICQGPAASVISTNFLHYTTILV